MPEARPPVPTEEPELRQEESVPSDGKDHKGEKIMEELGRNKPGKPLAPERQEE